MADEKVSKDEETRKAIIATIEDKSLPNIYFNGFNTSIGTSDIVITLHQNGKPVALLNTSFTIAKTLSQKLGSGIGFLEKSTGQNILTSDDIEKAFKK